MIAPTAFPHFAGLSRAAELAGITHMDVCRLIRTGKLRQHYRPGRGRSVRVSALLEVVASQRPPDTHGLAGYMARRSEAP